MPPPSLLEIALIEALKAAEDALASTRDIALGNDPDGYKALQQVREALALVEEGH